MAEKVTRTNQSADKIFDVVETMVRNGAPMRLNDIAKLSGIPQSTAFRMINALRERGYVIQDENSAKYTLSLKFSLIGDMVRAKFDLRDLVHPYMLNIAASCDGICYLAIPQQQELVYIDMVSPPGSVLTRMPFIGKHVPLHCGGNDRSGEHPGKGEGGPAAGVQLLYRATGERERQYCRRTAQPSGPDHRRAECRRPHRAPDGRICPSRPASSPACRGRDLRAVGIQSPLIRGHIIPAKRPAQYCAGRFRHLWALYLQIRSHVFENPIRFT